MLKVCYANIAPLRDEVCFQKNESRMHRQRREKFKDLKLNEDRLRTLAADSLLRIALESENIPYENLTFAYGKHGKPRLLHQNIYFNLSHAGDYAVCAICDQEVGVDIEQSARLEHRPEQVKRIARRILNERELQLWKESRMAPAELVKIWTRKESYAKMKGIGLSIGLETIDTIDGAFFQEMKPERGYYVTVCTMEECERMQVSDQTGAFVAGNIVRCEQ